jgi:hypothetical protein
MRRERGSECGLHLCLTIARKGTARLGVRPVHRGQNFGGVIDTTKDAKLGAASFGQRTTKALQSALELVMSDTSKISVL